MCKGNFDDVVANTSFIMHSITNQAMNPGKTLQNSHAGLEYDGSEGISVDASERRLVMGCGIPICIYLEPSEVVAIKPPAPLYLFVPRVSYLPHLIERCHEHFKPYMQPSFGQPSFPYFDFEGIAIDWRLPIGVVFDILSLFKGQSAMKELVRGFGCENVKNPTREALAACGCDFTFPLCLTVHFHGSMSSISCGSRPQLFSFPDFTGWAAFESVFINSLKQASFAINGSATPFQRMPRATEMRLLETSRLGSVQSFLDCCSQFLPPLTPRDYRRLPIRLHIVERTCMHLSVSSPCFRNKCSGAGPQLSSENTGGEGTDRTDASTDYTVKPLAYSLPNVNTGGRIFDIRTTEEQSLMTLGDLLHLIMPQLFPVRISGSEESTSKMCAESAGCLSKVSAPPTVDESGSNIGRRRCRVLVQGLEPLLQTPLFWLAVTAPQMDLFLHIVIRVEE